MPVEDYIFEEEIKDVLNFKEMENKILSFLEEKVGIHCVDGQGLNQNDYTDIYISVVVALIKLCALNGVSLTLMHF